MVNAVVPPEVLLIYTQRMVVGRTFESIGNLGILTLATRLRSCGFKTTAMTGITTDVMKKIESMSKTLFAACFYCDFDNQSAVAAMCASIRKRYGGKIKIVVGGPQTLHMTPRDLPLYEADAILRGDGEESLCEWLKNLQNIQAQRGGAGSIKPEDIEKYWITENLGAGDCPDDLLAISADKFHKMLTIITARGCPHRCAFCFEGGKSKIWRPRDVADVARELRARLEGNVGPRYVFFADDTLTASEDRLRRLINELAALRKDFDFEWFCEGHAAFLSRNLGMIDDMMSAGLVRMQIGMESGRDDVLAAYEKNIGSQDVFNVVQYAYKSGLPQMAGNFIIGGAFESQDTLAATRDFTLSLMDAAPGMLDISTTFVMPLPGTRISTHPHEYDIVLEDPEYVTSLEDFPVNRTKSLSFTDICGARAKFVSVVSQKMKRQFAEGAIDSRRILRDIEEIAAARGYDMDSAARLAGELSEKYLLLFRKDPLGKCDILTD
jgi:radical SAM superfamily enzyme YgiQ (UPF0313 family)